MPRRTESWQDMAHVAPAAPATNGDDAAEVSAETLNARRDAAGLAASDERATCDCPEYRRDTVCDHVLMAAAVRMVRRMIDAHSESDKPH